MNYTFEDFLNPAVLPGAIVYAIVFTLLAVLLARLVHLLIQRSMRRATDRTGFRFIDQLLQVLIFIVMAILYAQLVPPLSSLGTAMLASVSIASIVVGIAAQSTLRNLIAGFALLFYRPFRVGDQVQLATPKGLVTAVVDSMTLGYTILHDSENNQIIVPNSVMASVVILRLNQKQP